MKILIADDHTLFRDALVEYIKRTDPTAGVTLAKSYPEAVTCLEEDCNYDLVLLDLKMPGMSGTTGFSGIREKYPDLRVALISGTAEQHQVQEALDAGAVAYFPKTLSGKAMMRAIELVLSGEKFVPMDSETDTLMQSFYADPEEEGAENQASASPAQDFSLTPRETEVLQFLAKGASNKDIANELEVQVVTIKLHVRGICRKLDVKNRTQAALKAKDLGLVS